MILAWLRRRCWFGLRHEGPWRDVSLVYTQYRGVNTWHPAQRCATCYKERIDRTRFCYPQVPTPKSSPQPPPVPKPFVPPGQRPN